MTEAPMIHAHTKKYINDVFYQGCISTTSANHPQNDFNSGKASIKLPSFVTVFHWLLGATNTASSATLPSLVSTMSEHSVSSTALRVFLLDTLALPPITCTRMVATTVVEGTCSSAAEDEPFWLVDAEDDCSCRLVATMESSSLNVLERATFCSTKYRFAASSLKRKTSRDDEAEMMDGFLCRIASNLSERTASLELLSVLRKDSRSLRSGRSIAMVVLITVFPGCRGDINLVANAFPDDSIAGPSFSNNVVISGKRKRKTAPINKMIPTFPMNTKINAIVLPMKFNINESLLIISPMIPSDNTPMSMSILLISDPGIPSR
mmetsp:Transcript_22081/g.62769  ORF Transcript_22081/g.62769 Transcript_22081/m.62769 type:complete len:321 (+) Transcript_22081:209-1171(+)